MRAPTRLSRAARAVWRETIALHPHLTEADRPLLELYCRLSVQLDAVLDKIETDGPYAIGSKGTEYTAPACNIVFGLAERLVRLARELHVTFSTRPAASAKGKGSQQPRIARFQVS